MSHDLALVAIPNTGGVDEQVAISMAPFKQRWNDKDEKYEGFFDWYQIGGRFSGLLSGYDPSTDKKHIIPCQYCNSTGLRTDRIGSKHRAKDPHYTCNGCNGTGKCPVWPTEYKRHNGDIQPASAAPESDVIPSALLIDGEWLEQYTFNEGEWTETPNWTAVVKDRLSKHDGRVVVVDCHV